VTPGAYERTIRDKDGKETHISMRLWDTAGVNECNRLEVLRYPYASVVVLAYAIDSPDSFDWAEERVGSLMAMAKTGSYPKAISVD